MTSRTTLVSLTIAAVIGLGGVAGFTSGSSPATAPVVQAVPEPSASTELSYPTSTPSTAVELVSKKSSASRDFSEAPRHTSEAATSTTTAELPAPLTAEQEATIQAGLDESDRASEDAREHMTGTDYDLPYATTTTIADTESPAS